MISLSLWSTIAGVSVVAICCFASLVRLFCSSSSSEPRSDPSSLSSGHWQNCVYRDEDGEAADKPDERSRYRAGLPKLLIPAFALVTLVVSGVNCALFWPDKRYALIAGGWVCFAAAMQWRFMAERSDRLPSMSILACLLASDVRHAVLRSVCRRLYLPSHCL